MGGPARLYVFICLLLAILAVPVDSAENWWDANFESRITFKVDCAKTSPGKTLPFILKISDLELDSSVKPDSFRVVDGKGSILSCQFDDRNGDGKVDGDDELSMLLPVDKKSAVYSLYYSTKRDIKRNVKPDDPGFNWLGVKNTWNSLDNELVRVRTFGKNPGKLSISAKSAGDGWKIVAYLYYDEYKIDKKRGVLRENYRVEQLSSGPVRSILRETWDAKTVGIGKPFLYVKEWSVFKNSRRILLTYSIVNKGKYPIAWGYLCVGFYRVTPNGKLDVSSLRYAANSNGKVVEGALGETLYHSKPDKYPVYPWYDVFCGKPDENSLGIGCVLVKPRPMALFLGLVGKTSKNLRMTETYRHRGMADTIWPGKRVDCVKWYVIHSGNQKSTSEFSELLGGAKLTLLGQMDALK